MLHRITSLVLHSIDGRGSVGRLPSIPPNVNTIEDVERSTHPFPHVRTYKLRHGKFRADRIIDLQRLTTLTIASSFIVFPECQLILPSLRRFVCTRITLGFGAVFDAPLLEALEFRISEGYYYGQPVHESDSVTGVLDHSGFLLSPSTSLLLHPPLPSEFTELILVRNMRITLLEVSLDDDRTAGTVIAALTGRAKKEDGFACPQLAELRLMFVGKCRDLHSLEWWRDRAAQILEERRNFATIPRIYRSWDRGKTFMLLT
jgi:hypothetical protein